MTHKKDVAPNKPKPMIIRGPDGQVLFTMQSIKAGAVMISLIKHLITGQPQEYISPDYINGRLKDGDTKWESGPLKGYSIELCGGDVAQAITVMTERGLIGASIPELANSPTPLLSYSLTHELSNSLTHQLTNSLEASGEVTVKSECSHSEVTVTGDETMSIPVELPDEYRQEFEALFGGI